jgi:CHAD domain-containing protein
MRRLSGVFEEQKWWPVTQNSHVPVPALASQVLLKRYEKIHRMYSAMAHNSTETQVHDIRLQAKKLRYLLELFGSLFPAQEVACLTKRLKKLQNTLGDYNDLAVQQESLRNYVLQKTSHVHDSTLLSLAVGSLLGVLYRQQQDLRGKVFRMLTAFTADDTRALSHNLFQKWSRAA